MTETGELSDSQCQATTRAGVPCRNHALKDESFCVFHSESEAAREWRNAGRAMSGRKPVVRDLTGMPVDIKNAEQCMLALNQLYVAAAERDSSASNTAALLKIILAQVRCIELVKVEAQLRAMEEQDV